MGRARIDSHVTIANIYCGWIAMTNNRSSAPVAFVACPTAVRSSEYLMAAMQDSCRHSPPLGVYLLRSLLLASGRPCDIVDLVVEGTFTLDRVLDLVSGYRVLLFSCNSMNWATVQCIAQAIRKEHIGVKMCVGGPHPTSAPASVIRAGCFDALFQGDADSKIAEVYDALLEDSHAEIPGLTWCRSGQVQPGAAQYELALDAVWIEVDFSTIPTDTYRTVPVQTSRGCNQNCAFCSTPSRGNWRALSPAKASGAILAALEHIDRFISRYVSVVDDNFTADRSRAKAICRELTAVSFGDRLLLDTTLVDLQDEELVSCLAPLTSDLLVGAEVTNKDEARAIRKATSPRLIRQAASIVKRHGIASRSVFSFIIGFPWQSLDDCLRSCEFIVNLILDFGVRAYVQWYWPMPGSDIYLALLQEGRVRSQSIDEVGFFNTREWFYGCRSLTPEDVQRIDEYIRPVQLCLSIGSQDRRRLPLEYSPPLVGAI